MDLTSADDLLEFAWGIIANAGWDAHRGWTHLDKSPGWHDAAILWRDAYFEYENRRIHGRYEEPDTPANLQHV